MDRRRPPIHSGSFCCNELLHRRAFTVFDRGADASPDTLPAVASAFVEYLIAWRDASPDPARAAAATLSPLRERVARLDAALQRAEAELELSPDPSQLPDHVSRLEDEAAGILADVRDMIRTLHHDRPAAARLRLALMQAWGRYDDAVSELRQRGDCGTVVDADLAVMALLRESLLERMDSVRSLSSLAD